MKRKEADSHHHLPQELILIIEKNYPPQIPPLLEEQAANVACANGELIAKMANETNPIRTKYELCQTFLIKCAPPKGFGGSAHSALMCRTDH